MTPLEAMKQHRENVSFEIKIMTDRNGYVKQNRLKDYYKLVDEERKTIDAIRQWERWIDEGWNIS